MEPDVYYSMSGHRMRSFNACRPQVIWNALVATEFGQISTSTKDGYCTVTCFCVFLFGRLLVLHSNANPEC